MIRSLSKIIIQSGTHSLRMMHFSNTFKITSKKLIPHEGRLLTRPYVYRFSDLPRHQVLTMPALSPTMSEGKIVKWVKQPGEKVEEGDVICEIETDKATVGFQVQQKGYIAKVKESDANLPVGSPLAILVKKADQVSHFSNYEFNNAIISSKAMPSSQPEPPAQVPQPTPKQQSSSPAPPKASSGKSYPKHSQLKMPALSPTMNEGKIVKWLIKEGDEYNEGDALCEVQTDKATVPFEASEKGILAKILVGDQKSLKVGETLAVSVKKKEDAAKFSDYTLGGASTSATVSQSKSEPTPTKQTPASSNEVKQRQSSDSSSRVFASPAAQTLAKQKGINLSDIGKGSGPDGRIIRQDVEGYKAPSIQVKAPKTQAAQTPKAPSAKKTAVTFPENPFEQIPVNNMRKTIAARLTESKTTIPHYYVSLSIEMDAVNELRTQLNSNEKQNGVKISVNDIILKAMALALRDYPTVNSQWHGNVVKRFKYSDVSVAVATEGGLITPIVYRADTLGLVQIAKRTKDIAKRAREGKLDPRQYLGGTCTISNLGMFGIDSVTSVINPPQSTILGVGKTQKKILFDENSTNPDKPYRVASVMQVIVSADHRVVDGAVAAQWLTRVKKYLEHPTHMLL